MLAVAPGQPDPRAGMVLTWAPFSNRALAQATWPPRHASWREETRLIVTRFTLTPYDLERSGLKAASAIRINGKVVGRVCEVFAACGYHLETSRGHD